MNKKTFRQFPQVVGARRFDDLGLLLAPGATLRWITPGGMDEQAGAGEVVDRFRRWFGALAQVDVLSAHCEALGNRFTFAYQLRVCKSDGGWYTVQQQGVLDAGDTGIIAIDLVCTGFLVA